jgi:hypothetical protein
MTCWLFGHDTYAERDQKGVLEFVCRRCDRRMPAIQRTAKERAKMRRAFPAQVATKAQPVAQKIARFK